jgi:enolase
LYRYVGGVSANTLPVPMMNIINRFSLWCIIAFPNLWFSGKSDFFSHAMQMGTDFHSLKKFYDRGLSTAVGDEGGFALI